MAESADARGNAREREQRQEPGLAPERGREQRGHGDRAESAADCLGDVPRSEGCGEHAGAERGEAEPGEPVAACAGEEQQCQPEARDRAGEPREPDHRTSTVAVSTWPCSLTVRGYRPACAGACSFRTRPDAKPSRVPSRQW